MKTNLIKIPSLLAAITVALTLTACGGGNDEPPETVPAGVLADNPIGTCGDGVNLNEYNAIQKTTTREEALAIVCDAPYGQGDAGGGNYFINWRGVINNATVGVLIGRNKSVSNNGQVVAQSNFN